MFTKRLLQKTVPQRLDRRTAELESGAQNFKSMADELVKTLEGRKWWQI